MTIETIAAAYIALLAAVEIYCFKRFAELARERSDERTEARRERYRAIAYGEMNARRAIKENRRALWRLLGEVE